MDKQLTKKFTLYSYKCLCVYCGVVNARKIFHVGIIRFLESENCDNDTFYGSYILYLLTA